MQRPKIIVDRFWVFTKDGNLAVDFMQQIQNASE